MVSIATGGSSRQKPLQIHLSMNFFGLQGLLSLLLHSLDDFIQVCRRGDFRDSEIKAIPEVELFYRLQTCR